MSRALRLPNLSPEARAAIFHFTVFSSTGVAAGYFSVWLKTKGITPFETGIINALPVFGILLLNIFVGRLADRASDWKQVILLLSLAAAVIPFGLLFTSGFVGIAVLWTLFTIPAGSLPPIIDAATLRMTERNGTSFGDIRGWGTVGFMVAIAVTGWVCAAGGPNAFLPLLIGVSLARAALGFQLPRFRAPTGEPAAAVPNIAGQMRELMQAWFLLPLIAFALVQAAHAILAGFAAVLWMEQGMSPWVVGLLLAVAPAGEATVMFLWRRTGWSMPARQMILASAAATVLRWSVVALHPPVPVLFAMQLLHSITFAVGYLGTVHFIARWSSEKIAAEAQSFCYALQQAATVVALVIFGWLAGAFGITAFFASAGLGVIGVLCVLASMRLRPSHEAGLSTSPA